MCDIHTVEDIGWTEIGERIRTARLANGFTQAALAQRLGIDRTAVVRIEAGERAISAIEGARLAAALDVPLIQLVSALPASVASRRPPLVEEMDAPGRQRYLLDSDLETHARDTEWLIAQGFLRPPGIPDVGPAGSEAEARSIARAARGALDLPQGPLGPLADVAEHFALYLVVVDRDLDGASMLLETGGAAVLGGQAEPGRRRWTAAHELGHHLLRDAYNTDVGVAATGSERERIIDAFAGEFLLPEADVVRAWDDHGGRDDPQQPLRWLSASYRVSWGAAVTAAARAHLVPAGRVRTLRAHSPTRGDLVRSTGQEPVPDLSVGTLGAKWRQAVLAAYLDRAISGSRTVEMLRGRYTGFGTDDLPTLEVETIAP
jgi:transcriptional regulator with XRE-family HTH domain/Zn-dependent peptidase ImmA (M78 family)